MLKIKIPKDPISSQRVELDGDGKEYTIRLKWVSKFQRFYMDIYDVEHTPLIEGVKLVQGAPVNLPFLQTNGPKGLFVLTGSGDLRRDSLSSTAYTLYYLPRGGKRVPLVRPYTVLSDLNILLDDIREENPIIVDVPIPPDIILPPPLIAELPTGCAFQNGFQYPIEPPIGVSGFSAGDYGNWGLVRPDLEDPNFVSVTTATGSVLSSTNEFTASNHVQVGRRAVRYDFSYLGFGQGRITLGGTIQNFHHSQPVVHLVMMKLVDLPAVSNPLFDMSEGGSWTVVGKVTVGVGVNAGLIVEVTGLVPDIPNVWIGTISLADYENDFSEYTGDIASSIATGTSYDCP